MWNRLGKLYIINAPWGFSGAFNFIKRWLDPVTVRPPSSSPSTHPTIVTNPLHPTGRENPHPRKRLQGRAPGPNPRRKPPRHVWRQVRVRGRMPAQRRRPMEGGAVSQAFRPAGRAKCDCYCGGSGSGYGTGCGDGDGLDGEKEMGGERGWWRGRSRVIEEEEQGVGVGL